MNHSRENRQRQALVVDDEPLMLQMVSSVIQDAGYLVTTARDGAEGLRKFQEAPYALVVTDRGMPEMNGEELAGAIKAARPDVPVILITGLRDAVEDAALFEAILAKPFRRADLLAAVETAVNGARV